MYNICGNLGTSSKTRPYLSLGPESFQVLSRPIHVEEDSSCQIGQVKRSQSTNVHCGSIATIVLEIIANKLNLSINVLKSGLSTAIETPRRLQWAEIPWQLIGRAPLLSLDQCQPF
jgi:hypothetical protein